MRRWLATKLIVNKDTDNLTGSWLYKLGSQLLIDYNFPIHIYLELSRSCNYRCRMCARNDSSTGYMPLSIVTKMVEEAKQYGATSFSLHLYGEPLLSPYLFETIKLIKESNPHNVVLLTTNGSMLTPDISVKLINLGLDVIFISIPSLTDSTYLELTGGGKLESVLDNMSYLWVVRNNKDKPKIYARVYDKRINKAPLCDVIVFRKFHNFGGDSKYSQYPSIKRYPCYHPWYTLAVNYDGQVTICCADYGNKILLGNVNSQTLQSIWKSVDVDYLRHKHLTNRIPDKHKCYNCDVWNIKPDIFFNWQKG